MPRFFGDEARRLVREAWSKTTDLAEELYAMFASNKPLETDVPIIINQQAGQPGIIINQAGQEPPIQINPPVGTTEPPVIETPTTPITVTPPAETEPVPVSGVAFGRIAGGGPSQYEVEVYLEGPFRPASGIFLVPQLHFNGDESAPSGMPVVVYFNEYLVGEEIARDYWMLYPTWMEPPLSPP